MVRKQSDILLDKEGIIWSLFLGFSHNLYHCIIIGANSTSNIYPIYEFISLSKGKHNFYLMRVGGFDWFGYSVAGQYGKPADQ